MPLNVTLSELLKCSVSQVLLWKMGIYRLFLVGFCKNSVGGQMKSTQSSAHHVECSQ